MTTDSQVLTETLVAHKAEVFLREMTAIEATELLIQVG